MPTYDFINKETGEITEEVMSIHDLDKYKEEQAGLEFLVSSLASFFKYRDWPSYDKFFYPSGIHGM